MGGPRPGTKLFAGECQLSGTLVLGVSTTVAAYLLPWLLAVFRAEHSRLQLALHTGNTDEIMPLLLDDKVFLGLIEGSARQREVHTEPFMEVELVLIASPESTFERLVSVYGQRSSMTWIQPAKAGVDARRFQEALEAKS